MGCNDDVEEAIIHIPEVLEAVQPGYKLSIYQFAYCFASAEGGTEYLFLKMIFSEEFMAYAAAVTLPLWRSRLGIDIELASADMNTARWLRTIVCRFQDSLKAKWEGSVNKKNRGE